MRFLKTVCPAYYACRCEMGGLTVLHKPPAPRYDFEMLHAETGELFLHFKVRRRSRYIMVLFNEGRRDGRLECRSK